jgi:hypothetical protein
VRSRKLLLGVRHFGGCYTGPSPRCRHLADLARAQVLRPRCQSVETLSEQMPAKTTRSATLSCGASKAACRLSTRISQTAYRASVREPPRSFWCGKLVSVPVGRAATLGQSPYARALAVEAACGKRQELRATAGRRTTRTSATQSQHGLSYDCAELRTTPLAELAVVAVWRVERGRS